MLKKIISINDKKAATQNRYNRCNDNFRLEKRFYIINNIELPKITIQLIRRLLEIDNFKEWLNKILKYSRVFITGSALNIETVDQFDSLNDIDILIIPIKEEDGQSLPLYDQSKNVFIKNNDKCFKINGKEISVDKNRFNRPIDKNYYNASIGRTWPEQIIIELNVDLSGASTYDIVTASESLMSWINKNSVKDNKLKLSDIPLIINTDQMLIKCYEMIKQIKSKLQYYPFIKLMQDNIDRLDRLYTLSGLYQLEQKDIALHNIDRYEDSHKKSQELYLKLSKLTNFADCLLFRFLFLVYALNEYRFPGLRYRNKGFIDNIEPILEKHLQIDNDSRETKESINKISLINVSSISQSSNGETTSEENSSYTNTSEKTCPTKAIMLNDDENSEEATVSTLADSQVDELDSDFDENTHDEKFDVARSTKEEKKDNHEKLDTIISNIMENQHLYSLADTDIEFFKKLTNVDLKSYSFKQIKQLTKKQTKNNQKPKHTDYFSFFAQKLTREFINLENSTKEKQTTNNSVDDLVTIYKNDPIISTKKDDTKEKSFKISANESQNKPIYQNKHTRIIQKTTYRAHRMLSKRIRTKRRSDNRCKTNNTNLKSRLKKALNVRKSLSDEQTIDFLSCEMIEWCQQKQVGLRIIEITLFLSIFPIIKGFFEKKEIDDDDIFKEMYLTVIIFSLFIYFIKQGSKKKEIKDLRECSTKLLKLKEKETILDDDILEIIFQSLNHKLQENVIDSLQALPS